MRRRLNNEPIVPLSKPDSNGSSSTETDSKKTAAAIADKLAASTHSQQIMTSVLSSFAAEEAKNASLTTSSNTSNVRPKPEKPPMPETTTFVPVQSMPQAVLVQQTPVHNQTSTVPQPQYIIFATTTQQYIQPPSGMMIGLPYTYSTVPPLPPQPSPQMVNLVRPAPVPPQQQQMMMQQPVQPPPLPMPQPVVLHQPPLQPAQYRMQQPLQPPPPNYRPLQPPNMGFYPHQPQ